MKLQLFRGELRGEAGESRDVREEQGDVALLAPRTVSALLLAADGNPSDTEGNNTRRHLHFFEQAISKVLRDIGLIGGQVLG